MGAVDIGLLIAVVGCFVGLAGTDWTQVDDAPISDADRESMRQYRQTLRDIPSLESFPYNINFPNKPNLTIVGNQSVKTQKDEQVSILCQ